MNNGGRPVHRSRNLLECFPALTQGKNSLCFSSSHSTCCRRKLSALTHYLMGHSGRTPDSSPNLLEGPALPPKSQNASISPLLNAGSLSPRPRYTLGVNHLIDRVSRALRALSNFPDHEAFAVHCDNALISLLFFPGTIPAIVRLQPGIPCKPGINNVLCTTDSSRNLFNAIPAPAQRYNLAISHRVCVLPQAYFQSDYELLMQGGPSLKLSNGGSSCNSAVARVTILGNCSYG